VWTGEKLFSESPRGWPQNKFCAREMYGSFYIVADILRAPLLGPLLGTGMIPGGRQQKGGRQPANALLLPQGASGMCQE